ncbi:MAG: TMEM14 family protein [Parachlamydiaceae bacterium]|nr:TMEM14 family protein [Parachlamydiaceae bacterium]
MKITVGLYALLLLIGGIIGHYMANSLPSLIMGSITAFIFAVLAFQKGRTAHLITLVLTALLAGFFGYRFYLTLKFFPAGFMSLVSFGLAVALARDFFSSACCKSEPNIESR